MTRTIALALVGLALGAQLALAGGGPPPRLLVGTEAPDTLLGSNERDLIRGLGGNDEIYGGRGHDEVHGGAGEDHLYGGAGNDLLWGSNRGNSANLVGFRRERLLGGAGDDVMASSLAGAVLIGGRGADQLNAGARPGCTPNLRAKRRTAGAEPCVIWLLGGPGDDAFWTGNRATDVISCGAGRDVVRAADRIDRVGTDCELVLMPPG